MKWLEIIKVRSAGESHFLLEELLYSIEKLSQKGFLEIKIYSHIVLESDLSIHLCWESEQPEPNGSTLSLHLIKTLREFGLVDHSIWTEI
jgi:hypothetical protein